MPSSQLIQSSVVQVIQSGDFFEVRCRPGPVAAATGSEWQDLHLDDYRPPAPPPGGLLPPPPQGPTYEAGSGVIITGDGYIITSSHVVQGASQVRVTLYDRRQFDARVIALDPSTDIAVVKIDGTDFPVAELGRSDAVRVGEWVLALGSPLGLLFTATTGIISAKGRSLGILDEPGPESARGMSAPPLENCLQTDAAINPGNCGGTIVNLRGRRREINRENASA